MTGGVLQMINHGVSTGALFLLVGFIVERRHTREISALNGLQKVAPVFAAVFTVVMLSSIAVPGLNGFVGEFLILIGALPHRPLVGGRGLPSVSSSPPSTCCGPTSGSSTASRARRTAASPSCTGRRGWSSPRSSRIIVFIGVYPKPMLDRIQPSVERLITTSRARATTWSPRWRGGADRARAGAGRGS